jgi:hypothetical protein
MPIAPLKSDGRFASPIRHITADRERWRVSVETWGNDTGYHGRFVFQPDGRRPASGTREGPPQLTGPSREDVVRSAHEVTEQRLRALLHSLT